MTFPELSNGSLSGNRTGQGSQSGANRSWGLQGEESPEGNGTTLTFALDVQAVGVGVFLAIFILSAIVGNILVILSVACNRHLQTVTNYFIVNLAIADLLLSTTVLPFSATLEVLGFWVFGRIFCNIWAAVDVLCCSASIMSLCIISVDRYIGVKYSLKYPTIMTERKAGVILVVVWLSSMVISIGPLLGWKEPPPPDESICSITEEPGYALFSSLFSFYLPLMVILVMYFRIYVVARRTTRSLEAGVKKERNKSMEVVLRIHCRSVLEEPLSSTRSKGHNFRSSLSVRLLKFSREKKAAKTLAIVVGVFILCWFPFFFVLPFGQSTFLYSCPGDAYPLKVIAACFALFFLPISETFRNGLQGHLLAGILQQLRESHHLPLLQQRVQESIHQAAQVPMPPQKAAHLACLRPPLARGLGEQLCAGLRDGPEAQD
ncbi:alpha-1D adrenergic receptor isoform X2 [Tympanuchus pallidicinctus]|uniref:alpha-1D adrenergic receptor isoform X2 n=1 Tax=Tympanuchus pallidicinctus TaxID=109042 RepID=UPI00228730A2|nr:alpha-1D adrenergic receptor isoform X2 [Tympanuchus pallidicinctus]